MDEREISLDWFMMVFRDTEISFSGNHMDHWDGLAVETLPSNV